MKFTFICEDLADVEYSGGIKITHEFEHDDLSGILENFKDFLAGCSFQVQDTYLELNHKDESYPGSSLSANEFLRGPKNINDISHNAI